MSNTKSEKSAKKTTKVTRKQKANKSKGLGDTIEKVTEATGVKKLVKFIAGEDCGCDERKSKLNSMFAYKEPNCMTETEYSNWNVFREDSGEVLTRSEMEQVVRLHARLFNHPIHRPCTCAPKKWQNMISEINQLFETYDEQTD